MGEDIVDRKIDEFNELLERLFETYREVFTALRCERCVKRESYDELKSSRSNFVIFEKKTVMRGEDKVGEFKASVRWCL